MSTLVVLFLTTSFLSIPHKDEDLDGDLFVSELMSASAEAASAYHRTVEAVSLRVAVQFTPDVVKDILAGKKEATQEQLAVFKTLAEVALHNAQMNQQVSNHNGKIGLSDAAMVTNYRSTLRAARANHMMEKLLARLSTRAAHSNANNNANGDTNDWHVNEDHIDMVDAVLAHDYLANVWSAQLIGSILPPAAPAKATVTAALSPPIVVEHTTPTAASGGATPTPLSTPSDMVARTGGLSWLNSGFPFVQVSGRDSQHASTNSMPIPRQSPC